MLQPFSRENIFCNLVGCSAAMKNLFQRMKEVSRTNCNILIDGPRGSGKKLVARALHQMNGTAHDTMMSKNGRSISMEQIEQMEGGTFFIEEIGALSLDIQDGLARALKKNVRLMASTTSRLEEDERFFQYFDPELVRVPALCERKEDIPLLLMHFFERYSDIQGGVGIEEEAFNRLLLYDWPGNVRELENQVEQWMALGCSEVIKSSDLPEKFFHKTDQIVLPSEGIDLKKVLSDMEDSLIKQALKMTGENKNKASKLLRINRTTLIEKMKKKGLLKTNQEALSK